LAAVALRVGDQELHAAGRLDADRKDAPVLGLNRHWHLPNDRRPGI